MRTRLHGHNHSSLWITQNLPCWWPGKNTQELLKDRWHFTGRESIECKHTRDRNRGMQITNRAPLTKNHVDNIIFVKVSKFGKIDSAEARFFFFANMYYVCILCFIHGWYSSIWWVCMLIIGWVPDVSFGLILLSHSLRIMAPSLAKRGHYAFS